MPRRGKKKAIKRRKNMRGGAIPGDPDYEGDVNPVPSAPPTSKLEPIESSKRTLSGGSTYGKYNDNVYIKLVLAIGLMGMVWFFLSRSLIRHKYSEVVSYSLIAMSVLVSLLLVLITGIKQIKGGVGLLGSIKKIFSLVKFMLSKCLPALLILVQLGLLIYIMGNNADYIFNAESMPKMFNSFNIMALIMIFGQLYVWRKQLKKIITGASEPTSSLTLPGFVLAALFSGIAISQLYIILEYLKTDC